MSDKIVEAVIEDLRLRSERGIKKYGTTLERKDLSLIEWHQHYYEELLDAALYVKRILTELNKREYD